MTETCLCPEHQLHPSRQSTGRLSGWEFPAISNYRDSAGYGLTGLSFGPQDKQGDASCPNPGVADDSSHPYPSRIEEDPMGLFTRKPSRSLQAGLVKNAKFIALFSGFALQHQKTNPHKAYADQAIDLTQAENRNAIREELSRIIVHEGWSDMTSAQILSRQNTLASQVPSSTTEDAALITARLICSIDSITRIYYTDFPKYKPLQEMVNTLATTCCPGVAQTIGPDLPEEVLQVWPHFSQIFEDAKQSNLFIWPDV